MPARIRPRPPWSPALLLPPLLAAACLTTPVGPLPPDAGPRPPEETPRTRRAYLLLEDRCLADSGPPCGRDDLLAAAAAALAERVAREGNALIRSEAEVRAELHRSGVGHPNVAAAGIASTAGPPPDAEVATLAAGMTWPFPARTFGVAEWSRPGADGAPGPAGLVMLVAQPLCSLAPLPRWLPQPADVTVAGSAPDEYQGLRVYLADPSGAVRESPLERGRDGSFRGTVRVGEAQGRYVVEVVAERTAEGPKVLYLLPVEVRPDPPGSGPGPVEAAETPPEDGTSAAAAMADRVQAFRVEQGLRVPERDAALDGVARAHADDMAAAGFFAHVSPTRGGLEERLAAAGLRPLQAGENLAMGPTVGAAFRSLLESPAHRATFLDPALDRMGVAAARRGDGLWVFAVVMARVP